MSAELRLSRAAEAWRDRLRAYQVILDGALVASIKRGESVTLPVTPGTHRVWMRIDWCRSRILNIELRDNERAVLACRSGVRSLALMLLYVTLLRARYITLEHVARERLASSPVPE